jgi:ribonuclease III
MDTSKDCRQLQETLRHSFNNLDLLKEALRHSSFVNEQTDTDLRDNERLEFLGDAVLSLVIGHLLMQSFPQLREGDLSRIRANMVNETQLAEIARSIDLGSYLQLGKGELQNNGRDKSSLLANAFEAVMAAVFLDNGLGAAEAVIQHHFSDLVAAAPTAASGQDYKSRLQEAVQSTIREIPQYRVIEESGPDHEKVFTVSMSVGTINTQGTGRSKKSAEQDAARNGLELLEKKNA